MRKIILAVTLIFCFGTFYIAFAQTEAGEEFFSLEELETATKKVREKEKELMQKEQMLNAREDRLNAMEKDIIAREEALNKIRKEITDKLAKLDTGADEELNRLAKLYSSTKPKSAAAILVQMDVEKSAEIIRRIGAMNAGKIMAEISKQNPAYASKLTTYMAGDSEVKSLTVELEKR